MTKILLVEDNEMHANTLSRCFISKDYEVVIAKDGADGIAKAWLEKPDLILMDMNLPKINGWEATRQIKADETTQHIPIMALTAHTMDEDRKRGFIVGCDAYIAKPIAFPDLLVQVEAMLNKKAP